MINLTFPLTVWSYSQSFLFSIFYRAALEHTVAVQFESQSLATMQTLHLLKAPSFPGLKPRHYSFSGGTPDHERQGASLRKQLCRQRSQQATVLLLSPRDTQQSHTVTFQPHTPVPDIEWVCPEDEAHLRLNLSPLFFPVSGVFLRYSCIAVLLFLWLIYSVLSD